MRREGGTQLPAEGHKIRDEGVARLPPFTHKDLNVLGCYCFWLHSLNGELAASGIYAGILSLPSSPAAEGGELAASAADSGTATAFPFVDSDGLAAHYWDMCTQRDHLEQIHPGPRAG